MTIYDRTIRTIASSQEKFFQAYETANTQPERDAARDEYNRLDAILDILTSGAGTAETAAAINAGKIVLTDTRTDAEQASNAPPHWTLKTA